MQAHRAHARPCRSQQKAYGPGCVDRYRRTSRAFPELLRKAARKRARQLPRGSTARLESLPAPSRFALASCIYASGLHPTKTSLRLRDDVAAPGLVFRPLGGRNLTAESGLIGGFGVAGVQRVCGMRTGISIQ